MAHTIIIFSFTTVMSVSLVAALKCYAGLICLGASYNRYCPIAFKKRIMKRVSGLSVFHFV